MNVNDGNFKHFSMPIHNPCYKEPAELCFTADIFSVWCKVLKPEVIAGIVPSPLVYRDEGVKITLNVIKELKAGFPRDVSPWNEMSVQIPSREPVANATLATGER